MHIEIKRENPLVSVVAISYNHARWVTECLQSIKAQTYPHVELIYADDASQDESVSQAMSWLKSHWPNARIVVHETNRGLCATLNEALSLAKGSFIQLVSCDDVLVPQKLAIQICRLSDVTSEVGFAFGNFGKIDENSEIVEELVFPPDAAPPDDLLGQILSPRAKVPGICMATVLIARKTLGNLPVFDERLAFEGIQLWLKVLPRFRGLYLPRRLAWYRVVARSLSHDQTKLRRVTLGILELVDQALRSSELKPWEQALCERKFRCLDWLLQDAMKRKDAKDFLRWYSSYEESVIRATGSSSRLALANRSIDIPTLLWFVREKKIREVLGLAAVLTVASRSLVARTRRCIVQGLRRVLSKWFISGQLGARHEFVRN